MAGRGEAGEHVVPCYRAAEDERWYHFLHGYVPGHQIDFMYRPEVPQGALGREHYSHLTRLISYIEPHPGAPFAFAIGNLSRDDTQHEPGHGGVALIFGLRIREVTDHAGRHDPPFAHAVAAVDAALDAEMLFAAAAAFHRRVLGGAAAAEWYRSYVRSAVEAPAEVDRVLARYVASFSDLPRPGPSASSLAWTTEGGVTPPGRVVFVYPDDAPFEALARAAARVGAVLYRSDVRWSAISTGREADLPNGVSVRFVPQSAAGEGGAAAGRRAIEDLPADDEALAYELFGAKPVARRRAVAARRSRASAPEPAPGDEDIPISVDPPATGRTGREERSPAPEPAAAAPRRGHGGRMALAATMTALIAAAAASMGRGRAPGPPKEVIPPRPTAARAPPPPPPAPAGKVDVAGPGDTGSPPAAEAAAPLPSPGVAVPRAARPAPRARAGKAPVADGGEDPPDLIYHPPASSRDR